MHGVEGESGDQAMLGLGGCQKVWLSSALVEVWWSGEVPFENSHLTPHNRNINSKYSVIPRVGSGHSEEEATHFKGTLT